MITLKGINMNVLEILTQNNELLILLKIKKSSNLVQTLGVI